MAPPRRASLVLFFSLTFLVTWTCFLGASSPAGIVRYPLLMLGVVAPSLVALGLTARDEGKAGVVTLLRRLFAWRVSARWYVLAIGYTVAIKLTVAGLHRIATGAWPRFGDQSWMVMLAATLFSTAAGGQAGEEIGWRGYALPRMADRFGFAASSVILGVIWALWHLPLFFIAGTTTTGQSFPVYVLQVTAVSVALAWVYVRTNGSLLLTMLMHAAVNNFKDIVPSFKPGAANPAGLDASLVAWLTVAVMWVLSGYFLFRLIRLGRELTSPVATTAPSGTGFLRGQTTLLEP